MRLILKTASQFGKFYGIIEDLYETKPEYLKKLDLVCSNYYLIQIKNKVFYFEKLYWGGKKNKWSWIKQISKI